MSLTAYQEEVLEHVVQQVKREESALVAEIRAIRERDKVKRARLRTIRTQLDDLNQRRLTLAVPHSLG